MRVEFFAMFPPAHSTPLPPAALQFVPVRCAETMTQLVYRYSSSTSFQLLRSTHFTSACRCSPSMLRQERMPLVAWHKPENVDFTTPFNVTCDDETARIYRRAYYASVAYQDYNIGLLLRTLDDLEQTSNTIVCVFGDHGCASSS